MRFRKYEAQGFIEALLAILIAGVAVVAFMAVTTRTLGQVARNEIRDQLIQEAVQGSTLLGYAVEQRNATAGTAIIVGTEALFSDNDGNTRNCFQLDGNLDSEDEITVGPDLLCDYNNQGINPSACVGSSANWDKAKIDKKYSSNRYDYQDTMFRIVCIDDTTDFTSGSGVLVTRIYTGTESCRDYTTSVRNLDSVDESCILQEYTSVYVIEGTTP